MTRTTSRFLLALLFMSLAVSWSSADDPPLSVGDPVRFFLCRTTDGEPFLFGSTFLGGRVCLLSFFTTTCEHCLVEIPAVAELLRAEYPEMRLVYVGVDALTNDVERVARYVEPFGLEAAVLFDDGARIAGMYGIEAVPTIIVVDAARRIAYRKQGYEEGDMNSLREVLRALQVEGNR